MTPADAAYLRDQIQCPSAGIDLYGLISSIGEAQLFGLEEELARYLEYPDDAHVAGLALSTLCIEWRLAEKYKNAIINALIGVAWDDEEEEYKLQGMFSADIYLENKFDFGVFIELKNICYNENEYRDNREIALVVIKNYLENRYGQLERSNYEIDFDQSFDSDFRKKVDEILLKYN